MSSFPPADSCSWDKRRSSFVLIVTLDIPRPPHPDPEGHETRVVAMDPGVRHFQTLYDPHDGTHGELLASYHSPEKEGVPMAHELERRCRRIDRLVSRVKTKAVWERYGEQPHGRQARRRWATGTAWAGWYPGRTTTAASSEGEAGSGLGGGGGRRACRRWLRRRTHQARRQAGRHLARERARLDGFKNCMHYAAINFLWRHWDLVIVSTGNLRTDRRRSLVRGLLSASMAGEMCRRDRRPFGSHTARAAHSWAHYAFRQRLISSAGRRAGARVVETTEGYTRRRQQRLDS